MTRPVKEADAVSALLHDVAPEVEDRYATAVKDRYATAELDRYATAEPDRYATAEPDRYARAKPDRYARAKPDRYAAAAGPDRYTQADKVGSRKRILKTTIVLVEPPTGYKGDMLYMPAAEFERAYEYEYSNWMDLWQVGHVLNFTEAAEVRWETLQEYGETEAPWLLSAVVVSELSSMFNTDSEVWGEHSSELWPEALALARKIRARLVEDFSLVLSCLEDYSWAGVVAGSHDRHRRPTQAELLAALHQSTSRGLGAAAIDLVVWSGSDQIVECRELNDLLELIKEDDWVPGLPVENFVLDSGELHPDTQRVEGPYGVWYELFGEYLVADIEYHSDLARSQPYGWHNCRLVPHGTPTLPKFGNEDRASSYPQAFIDRAQGALFDEG